MQHSTQKRTTPSAESLLYITTFARVYSPQLHNESSARLIAQQAVSNCNNSDC